MFSYSYSGGLTNWSSSDHSSSSGSHGSDSSKSDSSKSDSSKSSKSLAHSSFQDHQTTHKTVATQVFTLSNPIPSNLEFTFTHAIETEAIATVISPRGISHDQSLIEEGSKAVFNYENNDVTSGNYLLNLSISKELSSGTSLGNVEVSTSDGRVIEHFEIIVP